MAENRESPAGNSQVNTYRCPRFWAWTYLKGFRGATKSEPLNNGSAIHEGQEVFYRTGSLDKALGRAQEILLSSGWDETEEAFIYQRAMGSLRHWVAEYGQADYDNGSVVEVEKQYNLTLPNGYVMTVRVDSLNRDKDGTLFIRDTKSTKGTAVSTMNSYMYKAQPILYVEALRQAGIDVKGWVTDVISSRLLKHGLKVECLRSPVVRPTEQRIADVLDSYADMTSMIAGSIQQAEDTGDIARAFPVNCEQCFSYFSQCRFYPVCSDINHILEPTLGTTLDPWLDEATVLDTYRSLMEVPCTT